MKTIKQEPGSKDCLACVAAMATDTTVEQYKEYCKSEDLPFDSDITFIRYIWDNGYMVGTFAPEGKPFSMSQLECVNIISGPAYIAVESTSEWVRKQGASHAVYWDGETLHDPKPDIEKPNLSSYKVLSFMNLVKNADHPRWKTKGL